MFQIQRVPLGLALQRAGITADDLRNIQRMAEDRITDELRRLAAEEAESAESNNNNNSSEEDDSSSAAENQSTVQASTEMEQHQLREQEQRENDQSRMEPETRMMEQMPPQRLILQQLPEQPRDTMTPPMPNQPQQMMPFGRVAFGRSLAQPVRIPVPMMQAQADMSQESSASIAPESERQHCE